MCCLMNTTMLKGITQKINHIVATLYYFSSECENYTYCRISSSVSIDIKF